MVSPAPTILAYPLLSEATHLVESGEREKAAQVLIRHLRQFPDEPRGLAQLGSVAMQLGALGQAEQFLRKAIAKGARDLHTRQQLAGTLVQQERQDEAEQMFAALAAESDDPAFPAIRAGILDKLGRNEEALAIHARLVTEHPDNPQTRVVYGHGLRSAGQVDEAIAAYRSAIAINDEFGEAWWGLANIKRKVLTDDDVAAMRTSLGIAIDIRNTAPLHFALARALHDRGDYAGAFEHYAEGNRQRAESLKYDAAELTDEVGEVERLLDPAFMARMSDAPVGTDRPVFIICLPRSGSTLLEQMLGSHPEIEPVGELPYIPAILRSFVEMATRRGPISVPQAIASLPDAQAAAFGREYLRRAALHRKTDRPFFIDKLPHNWSNVLFIRRILPQARFIDIRRPAMDCCFSNFIQSFTSAHASSFALRDVGQCYVDYVRLMNHFDRVSPGMIHHIGYSELVEDQRRVVNAALGHLGLPWDDAVLNFHQLDRVVRTPSSEQVRRPLNRDGMNIWAPYTQWLGPLREVLGELAEG